MNTLYIKIFSPLGCGFPSVQPSLMSKIINGNATVPHSFPWMVSIGYNVLNNSFKHVCGGSLISNQYILTAAKCVYGYKKIIKEIV